MYCGLFMLWYIMIDVLAVALAKEKGPFVGSCFNNFVHTLRLLVENYTSLEYLFAFENFGHFILFPPLKPWQA